MIFVGEAKDYGSLNVLVQAATALVSVAGTIGALWWIRPKFADIPDALVKAGEVVLTVVALSLLWTQLSEPSSAPLLIRILIWLASAFLIALVCMVVLGMICALKKPTGPNSTDTEVGGFWLTQIGRSAVTTHGSKQQAYAACAYDPTQLWPLPSRALAQGLFFLSDLAVAVAGSGAIIPAVMLFLIFQVPRVIEFSVEPSAVVANGTVAVHWKVSDNADSVQLSTPESQDVAKSGSTTESVSKETTFKLTAKNKYGSRSVEQGVAISAITPSPVPKPPSKSSKPKPQPTLPITVEARTCDLIRNVVIRGSGWLETEADKDSVSESRAECAVSFPTAGKYEMFVTYASDEARPVRITLNRKILQENALAAPTGGWTEPNELEQSLGVVQVNGGRNIVEFFSTHPLPHIQRFRFRPSS